MRWFEGHGRCIFRCEVRPWDAEEEEEAEDYYSEEEEREEDEGEEDVENQDAVVHNTNTPTYVALSRALAMHHATVDRLAVENLALSGRFVEAEASVRERIRGLEQRLAEAQARIRELEARSMDPTRRQVEMLGRIVVLRRRYGRDGQRVDERG